MAVYVPLLCRFLVALPTGQGREVDGNKGYQCPFPPSECDRCVPAQAAVVVKLGRGSSRVVGLDWDYGSSVPLSVRGVEMVRDHCAESALFDSEDLLRCVNDEFLGVRVAYLVVCGPGRGGCSL